MVTLKPASTGGFVVFAEHALEADGSIALTLNIMINGRRVGEGDLSRPLVEDDEVLLFMPLSGG